MVEEERHGHDEGEEGVSFAPEYETCRCVSELRYEIRQLKQSLTELVLQKRAVVAKMTRIVEGRQRVTLRQRAYEDSKQRLRKEFDELQLVASANQKREERLGRVRTRDFTERLISMEIEHKERWREVEEKREKLQEARKEKIVAIQNSVFPIQVDPLSVDDAGDEDYQQSAVIDVDASLDVDGGWLLSGVHLSPSPHASIITASLPLNGDYSAYLQAADERRKKLRDATEAGAPLPPVTTTGLNPLFQPYLAVPTGLQFTAQLVEIVADILNIPLPHPLHIPFSILEYGDQNKRRKIFQESLAKLDDDIILLCFSQNVPLSALSIGHTLSNLLALVTHPELGRQGAFECHPEFITYTGGGGGGGGGGDGENEPPLLYTADLATVDTGGDGGGEEEETEEYCTLAANEDDDWSRVEMRGGERRGMEYESGYMDYMALGASRRDTHNTQEGGTGLFSTISSLFGSTFTNKTTT